MNSTPKLLACAFVAVVIASGCGGNEASKSDARPPRTPAPASSQSSQKPAAGAITEITCASVADWLDREVADLTPFEEDVAIGSDGMHISCSWEDPDNSEGDFLSFAAQIRNPATAPVDRKVLDDAWKRARGTDLTEGCTRSSTRGGFVDVCPPDHAGVSNGSSTWTLHTAETAWGMVPPMVFLNCESPQSELCSTNGELTTEDALSAIDQALDIMRSADAPMVLP